MNRRLRSPVSFAVLALLGTRALAQSRAAASPTWVDYDGDGRIDLALLDEAGSFQLYRNEAQGFREVTAEAGLARLAGLQLARWADFDRDGRADLLVASSSGALELLRSTGGTFETLDAGLGTAGVVSAEWTDVDGDGWSDLWIRGEAAWSLFRNRQGRSLEPVTSAAAARAAIALPAAVPAVPAGPSAEDAGAPALGGTEASDPARRRSTGPAAGGSGLSRARATAAAPAASPGTPRPESHDATYTAPCARTLFDEANGGCMSASSAPALGKLFPLSQAFNVDPAGSVGIGALGPTHRLTVTSSTSDALRLIGPGASYGFGARLNFGDGNYAYLYEDVDDSLEIHSSGRTALTGGFVGIGTTAPSWPLHVVGTQGVGRFDSTNNTFGSVIELRNSTASPIDIGAINFVNSLGQYKGQIAYTGNNALTFNTNGAERLRIDGGGSVGIGTTFPFWPLHVVGTRGYARFDSTNSTYGSAIELHNFTANPTELGALNFVDANAQLRGQIAYRGVDDALTLSAGGTERLRISGTGQATLTGYLSAGGVFSTSTGAGPAVSGSDLSNQGYGIFVAGVRGSSDSYDGKGILGYHNLTYGTGAGVYGWGYSPAGYGVYSNGDLGASGAKYFVQPHPSDPSKEIRFACLEGNESGTYFRARARLQGGTAEVDVPEEFRLVTEPDDLTVQLTTVGRGDVWVESYDLERVVVAGDRDVEVHVLVQGVRRGFADFASVRANQAYVPQERCVPFGTQFPEGLRRILVENGTLNADFTPNEATAAGMGWQLRDPTRSPVETGGSR